jgi:hypothetical protein
MQHERDPQPAHLTLEQVTATATETLLTTGSHPPLLILDGEAEPVGFELELPNTAARRQEVLYMVGIFVARNDMVGTLHQVFLITEAWMGAAVDPGTDFRPPSEDPNRKEVLLIMNRSRSSSPVRAVTLEMLRDDQGVLQALKDVSSVGPDHASPVSPLLDAFLDGYTILR